MDSVAALKIIARFQVAIASGGLACRFQVSRGSVLPSSKYDQAEFHV